MIFDDVNVSVAVERKVGGEKIPVPYVVRKANEKTFKEIVNEIRAAQAPEIDPRPNTGRRKNATSIECVPEIAQFARKKNRLVEVQKEYILEETDDGSAWHNSSWDVRKHERGWPITIGFHSLEFALGGITKELE